MGWSDAECGHLLVEVPEGCGHRIPRSEEGLVVGGFEGIARTAGASRSEKLDHPASGADHPRHLHQAVVEAMVLQETSFFRDRRLFEALRMHIFPRLVNARASERRLRIWSAAASTGQEAYSVAMLICEHFPDLLSWDLKILGTDICSEAIGHARRGLYRRLEVNRGLPARMLLRYFDRDGEQWEVASAVRSICEFRTADLCHADLGLPEFDLVLLRNVLLYFSPQDRKEVLQRVHRQIAHGGFLALGASEQAEDSTEVFCAEFFEGCCFYRPASI